MLAYLIFRKFSQGYHPSLNASDHSRLGHNFSKQIIAMALGVIVLSATLASCSNQGSPSKPVAISVRIGKNHPILFGIIPGGTSTSDLTDLHLLDGGKTMLVHIYEAWNNHYGTNPPWLRSLTNEISVYSKRNLKLEIVLRYMSQSGNVMGYTNFVRDFVDILSKFKAVRSLQITNEANSPLNAQASDGAFPNANQALVSAVQAAHAEIARIHSKIQLGFNAAYEPIALLGDWYKSLNQLSLADSSGRESLASQINWVGIDLYPGTYFPPLASANNRTAFESSATKTVINALNQLRTQAMPQGEFSKKIQIEITEIGYATSVRWSHTSTDQNLALEGFLKAACDVHVQDNLSTFEFFDLQDAKQPSAYLSPTALHLPWRFGLVTYDNARKPAFTTYHNLIDKGC